MLRTKTGIASLIGFAALGSCVDTPSAAGGDLSNPAVLEAAIKQKFLDGAAGVLDGVQRVIAALNGGPLDGVTLTSISGGVQAAVSVDLNDDGSRESTITAQVVGLLNQGATLSITQVAVPQIPSLTGFGSGTLVETSPGVILLDNMGGNVSADPPGSGNSVDVFVDFGTVSLDLLTGNPTGSVSAGVVGESDPLFVAVSFEPNGQGGFRVRFTSSGFDFTIP